MLLFDYLHQLPQFCFGFFLLCSFSLSFRASWQVSSLHSEKHEKFQSGLALYIIHHGSWYRRVPIGGFEGLSKFGEAKQLAVLWYTSVSVSNISNTEPTPASEAQLLPGFLYTTWQFLTQNMVFCFCFGWFLISALNSIQSKNSKTAVVWLEGRELTVL